MYLVSFNIRMREWSPAHSKQIFTSLTSTQKWKIFFFFTVHFTANKFKMEINFIEAWIMTWLYNFLLALRSKYEEVAARSGLWPPHTWGFYITHKQQPNNTQQVQETCFKGTGEIRTYNLSRRAAVDPSLRQRGHWDRQWLYLHKPSPKSWTRSSVTTVSFVFSFIFICWVK